MLCRFCCLPHHIPTMLQYNTYVCTGEPPLRNHTTVSDENQKLSHFIALHISCLSALSIDTTAGKNGSETLHVNVATIEIDIPSDCIVVVFSYVIIRLRCARKMNIDGNIRQLSFYWWEKR